ncbi:MAG: DEAD/DEAH box helicase [Acidilobaceae archaeon]
MEVREATARLLEILGYRELFPPQRQALEAGVESGHNLIVAAPTASGKTLIGLIAIVNRLYEKRDRRAVYTVPLRSIALEKYREVRKLEALGFRVGVSVGDYTEGDVEGNIVVTTYEKLDSLLRNNPGIAEILAAIVVDEIHYVGDPERGPVLESLIAKLLSSREPPQIIGLSATVPNAGEIADWIGAKLVVSDWRPVPLREGVYWDGLIKYSNGETHRVSRTGDIASVDLVVDINKVGGQAIVFVQARRRAVATAEKLAKYSAKLYFDERTAREAASEILESDGPKSLKEEIASLVRRGVAYHHAGLSSTQRRAIEDAFRRGGLAAISATPTLAAGVNLPARRVVVDDIYRFEEGIWKPLSVAEYKQLAGRAGRPGLDPQGEAVIVAESSEDVDELLNAYARGVVEPVSSSLGGLRGLRHMALGLIASKLATSLKEVLEVVSKTLYARGRRLEEVRSQVETAVRQLELWRLIEGSRDSYRPTALGVEVSRSYLDPQTVPVLEEILDRLAGVEVGDLEALLIVAFMPDMTLLPASKREISSTIDRFLDYSPRLASLIDWDDVREARAARTALVLHDWVNEVSEDSILESYGVGPGDIAVLVDSAEWIASSLASVVLVGFNSRELSQRLLLLSKRLRHGVKPELLPLVAIPRIGRVRARRLYEAGYRTLYDLMVAKPEDLAKVPGIGPATVEAIMEFLGISSSKKSKGRGLESFMES